MLCCAYSAVTCPPVPTIANCTANTTLAIYATVVKLTCELGFAFPDHNQSQYIACEENAEWNQTITDDCLGKSFTLML